METQLEILESEALKLTPSERPALAQRLLASLDVDSEIEEAWAAEIERRIADVESVQFMLCRLLRLWLKFVPG